VVSAAERDLTAAPGAAVRLTATATDPDGDDLEARWWVYEEAGTLTESPSLESDGFDATLTLPATAEAGQRAVVVLEVTDDGAPSLTRYAQFVVTVG